MRTHGFLAAVVMTLTLLVPGARPANAQTTRLQTSEALSWSRNIPKKDQDAAEETLQVGNDLMREFAFAQAEEKYRRALAYWDHPGVHYNLALALLQLDRPVEAHEHFVKALQGGKAVLGAEKYDQALSHKKDLEQSLAWVEFSSESPDAVVTVDGQRLSLVNGHYEGLMRAGKFSLVARKEGYQTREKELALAPGKTNRLHLKLYTEDELIRYTPRWTPWKPWAVVGAGTVLAASSGLLYWQARQGYRAFDDRVLKCAKDSAAADHGCREPELASRRSRVERLNKVSIGTMALGGAALATGTALVLLNRAEAHHIDADELDREQGLIVMPLLGGGANGVLLSLQY